MAKAVRTAADLSMVMINICVDCLRSGAAAPDDRAECRWPMRSMSKAPSSWPHCDNTGAAGVAAGQVTRDSVTVR